MTHPAGCAEAYYKLPSLKYDVPRSRERDMRGFTSTFRKWNKATKEAESHMPIADILEEVARGATADTRIYFWGNPVYEHSYDPQFNFVQWGLVQPPARASFKLNMQTHPFGCQGRDSKNGASMFIITHLEQSLDSRIQRQLESFYDDFFQAQGAGELQRFGPANADMVADLFGAEMKVRQKIEQIDATRLGKDPEALRLEALPPEERALSSLFICDSSGSNHGAMKHISERLASQVKSPYLNYGLILFGRKEGSSSSLGAYIHKITDEPNVMAEAFLGAPAGGMDTPGALYSALYIARDKLRAVQSKGTDVVVMADVTPVDWANIAAEFTYAEVVKDLIADGHTLKFIKSNPAQNTSWITPGTFIIEDL